MTLAIQPLTDEYIPAVKEFNSRLTAAGAPFDMRLREFSLSDWLPKRDHGRLYQEDFVVLQDGVVRGGYRMKRQDFSFGGKVLPVDCFHWPISEAAINKAYSWVFVYMLRHVQRNQPLVYSLGMAGDAESFIPRMLRSAGWKVKTLPFFFKAHHAGRFLRELRAMRKTALRRWLLDAAAYTRIGSFAIDAAQYVRAAGARVHEEVEGVQGAADWADDLWRECKDRYAMIAARDSESLNLLYPGSSRRYLSYRISREEKTLGWAVLLDTRMKNNKYFGNMRVGTVVDCLARPENAAAVVRAATRILEERDVDLLVSNQLEAHWCSAFRSAGFFAGPSNFSFAVSPDLSELLYPFDRVAHQVHMTRGDGEGPLHL
jgi:hypothetical protein